MFPLLFLLAACGGPATEPAAPAAAPAPAAPAAAPAPAAPAAAAAAEPAALLDIPLDNGAKWQMDEHTRAAMAETRQTVSEAKLGSIDDAHALGTTLQGQFEGLVQGCTMEGPAHDQLHTFIGVYVPALSELQTAEDLGSAQRHLARLDAVMGEYERYFE